MTRTSKISISLVSLALAVAVSATGFVAVATSGGESAQSPPAIVEARPAYQNLASPPVDPTAGVLATPVPILPPVPVNPRVAELTQKYRDLDREILGLVGKSQKTQNAEEKAGLREGILERVSLQFDLRQEARELEVERLRKQLAEVELTIGRYKELKERAVECRVTDLLDENAELRWEPLAGPTGDARSAQVRLVEGPGLAQESAADGNSGQTPQPPRAVAYPDPKVGNDEPREAQSFKKLQQIALAMLNYHNVYKTFPPAYQAENSGKPLLSWRVLILPYLGQESLYREFHLAETWDSEHNIKLIQRMPAVYRSPGSKTARAMTNYLTVRGPNTVFPGKDGVGLAQIPDGSSWTILVVEASDEKAVVWTKPDDVEYIESGEHESGKLPGLVGLQPDRFLAAFCDGSVRALASDADSSGFKKLFLRNDGPLEGPFSTSPLGGRPFDGTIRPGSQEPRPGAEQDSDHAAQQGQSMKQLKQIGLAMLNYHDVHKLFPPAYRADNSGKPLLSWRVLILPYLEQEALYREFRLAEPWDSEHNTKLIERMPTVYRSPGSKTALAMTNYLTVRGPNTVFPGKDGVGIAKIFDGTSNTIMVVEASDQKAVVWTKPDDFEYNDADPLAGVIGLRPAGFLAALCDGAGLLIPSSAEKETLRRLFLRNDGMPNTIAR